MFQEHLEGTSSLPRPEHLGRPLCYRVGRAEGRLSPPCPQRGRDGAGGEVARLWAFERHQRRRWWSSYTVPSTVSRKGRRQPDRPQEINLTSVNMHADDS